MSRCRAYISSTHHTPKNEKQTYPSITISRLSGSGGFVIGQRLVEKLNKTRRAGEPEWTLFDKNLVQQVIEDHHLPKSLESFYSEAVESRLEDIIEEMLHLHPGADTLVAHTCRTIARLLRKGHVIILGRGGNIIGRHLDSVTHVRLVAPLAFRLQHTTSTCGLSPREAEDFIQRADAGREKYFKRYFKAGIDDPLLYDMVLNSAALGFNEVVRQISESVSHRKQRLQLDASSDVFQP